MGSACSPGGKGVGMCSGGSPVDRRRGGDGGRRSGDRVGIYYAEPGACMRPSKVIYDRTHSSICEISAADFDWQKIFKGAHWFHTTGITPAISAGAAAATLEAMKAARA